MGSIIILKIIDSIYIENYRGFKKHKLNFKDLTLMIGKNNAGKSTIIEILRIATVIIKKYKNLAFKDVPAWINDTHTEESRFHIKGVSPEIKKIIRQYSSIPHRYEGIPYTKIKFKDKSSIEIFYGENESIFAILREKNNKIIKNKHKALQYDFPKIATLPQIGPLNLEENILQDETIKRAEMLSTTSLHFRNKLLNNSSLMPEYKKLVQSSWTGLTVHNVENNNGNLTLLLRENDFTAEIGSMGHGLQMWMQILWFINTEQSATTLIIDEPDVYLHADLQNKLYEILLETNKQIILSSHSFEFISKTDPKNVLIIQKGKNTSKYANDNPTVQTVINDIGYTSNLEFIKFSHCKKCLYLEGDDDKILSCFASILGYENYNEIPIIKIGGKTQWKKVIGANEITKVSSGNAIKSYCVLDKDYSKEDNNTKIKEEALENGIELIIWDSKEIENYLINPDVIHRIVSEKQEVTKEDIIKLFEEILEKNKQNIVCQFGQKIQDENKGLGYDAITKRANEIVNYYWNSLEEKIKICSGKEILKSIKTEIQERYQTSFSNVRVAKSFKSYELSPDIINFFKILYKD